MTCQYVFHTLEVIKGENTWRKSHCTKEATHHTELGYALKYGMTEVCDEHLRITLMEEQVKQMLETGEL